MPESSPVRIIQLTPPGRGAIATLRIEGPGAAERVERQFRPAGPVVLTDCDANRPVYGRFGPEPGEEIVVRRQSAEAVELHCHGGDAAVGRLVRLLSDGNVTLVGWRAWAETHQGDPIAAAAQVALADARTERTAMILLDQYNGALRRAVASIQAALDRGDLSAARRETEAILAQVPVGRHLTEPWRIVVAGEPNVGKSSLINALVGYDRAIVHPTPGTTRDVVTATTVVDGWPLELRDTAGLREGEHPLERAGVELARRQLVAAELVLLVFDASRPWSPADEALRAQWTDALVVHNKSDLGLVMPRPAGLAVSALTGEGTAGLLQTIVGRLIPHPPNPGGPVSLTAGQVDRLQAAVAAMDLGDLENGSRVVFAMLEGTKRLPTPFLES